KHFTLDKSIKKKNDHFHSMDCSDLTKAKNGIDFLKKITGSGKLVCLDSERTTRTSVRRSAVALVNIEKGEILTEDKIIFKRPGNGVTPQKIGNILGKNANIRIEKDSLLQESWFE
ncbi:MAG: hypothetical protein K5829_06930, partial [Treponema sp.]|nr:hypothetical protein [Treponema sp.]